MGRRSLDKLNEQLSELEARIKDFDLQNDSVSSASVGWHLEHCFLVFNGVVDVTEASDPNEFKWKFNFSRMYCFALKRFPRGKARAPRPVRPDENVDLKHLEEHLEITKEKVRKLSILDEGQFFGHRIFGDLRLSDTIRFLELHTGHHLKIVGEIVTS